MLTKTILHSPPNKLLPLYLANIALNDMLTYTLPGSGPSQRRDPVRTYPNFSIAKIIVNLVF